MLINVSNHPSEKWSDEQRKCSLEYGEIIDMAFPSINVQITSEGIDKLVEEYSQKILMYHNPVVLLQGEYIFTYRLVRKLKARGLKVVAACSERKATEYVNEEGITIKKSEFVFCGYREY